MIRLLTAVVLPFVAVTALAATVCTATSGVRTAALVELYTSEGCSSCPPADRWLVDAPATRYRPDQLVPLALHVPYWDAIGWTDILARQEFARRQSWLVAANGLHTVYTPHFFVSGTVMQDWRSGLEGEITRINAQVALARIALTASLPRPGVLAINVEAALAAGGDDSDLFLAITEDKLVSVVSAGENQGARLRHDHVVRALVGPLAMPGGRIADRRELRLDPGWQTAQLGVAAFVQESRGGRVFQAVSVAPCHLAP